MIHWLAQAARQLREEAGRKQVHIAATMSIDQSTIYRFEQGNTWPKRADLVVAAYAEDLDISDPREIWELAMRLWREHGEAPTVADLQEPARQRFEQAIDEQAQSRRRGSGRSAETSRPTRRRRAG